MAEDVITGFRLGGTDAAADVITRFRLGAGAINDVITKFRLTQEAAFSVRFADPIPATTDPFDYVPLTVVATLPPETVTVTQTGGSPVTILGSGLDRGFRAPALKTGTALSFLLTASRTGQPNATFAVTIAIRAHGGMWRKNGTAVQALVFHAGGETDPTINSMVVAMAGSNVLSLASVTVPTYPATYTSLY